MTDTILKLERLSKNFNGVQVIRDIDLEVEEGTIFGFLGPDGAGKTTTIRLISGLLKPTSGSAKVCGYNVQKNPIEALRNIGVLIESPAFYDYLTGRENLELFSKLSNSTDRRRIKWLLEFLALDHYSNTKVRKYSLGMKQRLGIAMTLAHRPKIIILDEPTLGLDHAGMQKLLHILPQLVKEEGITVFLSSQFISEVEGICNYVGIIHKGRLIAVDKTSQLRRKMARLKLKVNQRRKARGLLQDIPWIRRIELTGKSELVVSTPINRHKEVNRILSEASIEVLQSESEKADLEEIFFQLIDENNTEDSSTFVAS